MPHEWMVKVLSEIDICSIWDVVDLSLLEQSSNHQCFSLIYIYTFFCNIIVSNLKIVIIINEGIG